jgi:hypothetical protein
VIDIEPWVTLSLLGVERDITRVLVRGKTWIEMSELPSKEMERFTGEGWEQEDDITLLTLRRSASLS